MVGINTIKTKIKISKIILETTILIYECSQHKYVYAKIRELVKISGIENTINYLKILSNSYKDSYERMELIYSSLDMINELKDRGVYSYQSTNKKKSVNFDNVVSEICLKIVNARPILEDMVCKIENTKSIPDRLYEFKNRNNK